MIDPETTRQAAHVFLDAVTVHQGDEQADDDTRDDMMGLALDRLGEVRAVRPVVDESGQITGVDIRRLTTAAGLVIHALVRGWARETGADPDELIAHVRGVIDEALADDED